MPRGRGKPWTKCCAQDCERHLATHGYCWMHWGRVRRRGTTEKLVRTRKAFVNTNGYIYDYIEGQRQAVPQHRIIMEKRLGRKLYSGETVHHKNGIRGDNADSNLELWASWQPNGCRVSDLVRFARAVLRRYS